MVPEPPGTGCAIFRNSLVPIAQLSEPVPQLSETVSELSEPVPAPVPGISGTFRTGSGPSSGTFRNSSGPVPEFPVSVSVTGTDSTGSPVTVCGTVKGKGLALS